MEPSSTGRDEVRRRLEAACAYAREAGEYTLGHFRRKGLEVRAKGDGTAVTQADRGAEELIRAAVKRDFAGDGILGEEFGESVGTSGYRWVLDPVDGTTSFVHGVPLYGTLIAVETMENGKPRSVAGVIHMPAMGETVYAGEGSGAWHIAGPGASAQPARVSATRTLGDAMLLTTAIDYFAKAGRRELYLDLVSRVKHTRGWSDCYAHLLVATGRADAVIEPWLHPWDIAPMTIIMREAGGRHTDWAGVETAHSRSGLTTNGAVHDELLALLGEAAMGRG